MTKLFFHAFRYVILTVITGIALAVMWWTSSGDPVELTPDTVVLVSAPPTVALPRPRVAIQEAMAETIALTTTYSGKLRPWETYSLSFGVGGKVLELGSDASGTPLDDGDHVEPGQVLARLDDRIYRARKSEAAAQLEEAATEMQRARSLRRSGDGVITDSEYQEALTRLALARAQQEVALKNLDDATLISPVKGTISRRLVNIGESVDMNRVVFEIVQDDDILLVVDVPESQVARIDQQMRTSQTGRGVAQVRLEGNRPNDREGTLIEAEVYRIAEVADTRTGLFEVEVKIPNPDRKLRAGMVATADIVVDEVRGYRVPESAIIFRGRDVSLFALQPAQTPRGVMFWELGAADLYRAKKILLTQWYEQGESVVIPSDAHLLARIVVRGQERLSDGQFVRIAQVKGPKQQSNTAVTADDASDRSSGGENKTEGDADYES